MFTTGTVRQIDLRLLGNAIAKFIEADPKTTNTTKNAHPHICVEVDMTKPLLIKVYIQIGDVEGYWQTVAFEGNPMYCIFCKLHGHSDNICHKKAFVEKKRNNKQHSGHQTITIAQSNSRPTPSPRLSRYVNAKRL